MDRIRPEYLLADRQRTLEIGASPGMLVEGEQGLGTHEQRLRDLGAAGAGALLENGERGLDEGERFRGLVQGEQQRRQLAPCHRCVAMVLAEIPRADLDVAPKERLGLLEPALRAPGLRQLPQRGVALGHVEAELLRRLNRGLEIRRRPVEIALESGPAAPQLSER